MFFKSITRSLPLALLAVIDAACGVTPVAAQPASVNSETVDSVTADSGPAMRQAIEAANEAVAEAAAEAADDPMRPQYHFRPLARWMNDPNGPLWHRGWYHLFFQHNPYGDRWGNIHWGHARSRDLVRWEHLPIAMAPSGWLGEDHMFSGCATRDGDGRPVLLYTSVGSGRPYQQWAAVARDPADPRLSDWQKLDANPLLTIDDSPGQPLDVETRDPFVFNHQDRKFMILGTRVGGRNVLPIYEATDQSMLKWQPRGELWSAPGGEMKYPECPNFFPLDGRHVLLLSPFGPVQARVGRFDVSKLTFEVEHRQMMEPTKTFYGTNVLSGPAGRTVLLG